jgi:hypothetical protein
MSTKQRVVPSPITSPETEPFWAAAREGRFLVKWCTDCGRAHWYPRAICPHCQSSATEWRPGSGRGTIYSFSPMRRADPPYTLAYVTLAEGPTMLTNIVAADPDALAIGQPVKLEMVPSEDGTPVPMFRPA